MIFGEDRVCRVCHGSGEIRGMKCAGCDGTKIERSAVQRPPGPERVPGSRDGKVLRDQGMEKVERHEETWNSRAIEWIRSRPLGEVFTADDLVAVVGLPQSRNAVGAAVSGASRRGLILPMGIDQSERPDRHAGMVRKWIRSDG